MTILGVTRTDANGCYELKYDSAKELKGVVAFQKRYLPTLVHACSMNRPKGGGIEVDTVSLSRSATLKMTLKCEEGMTGMSCRFIDANSEECVWAEAVHIGSKANPVSSLFPNQVNTLPVPTGVRMRILLSGFSSDGAYDRVELPREIELKPGEILDLGEVNMKAK